VAKFIIRIRNTKEERVTAKSYNASGDTHNSCICIVVNKKRKVYWVRVRGNINKEVKTMLDIVRRNFHEAGLTYNYELADGTRLHYNNWNGEGFVLCDAQRCVMYVPVENPYPFDNYGEPDYYDVIGFERKPLS
jgi:hypothetical protein